MHVTPASQGIRAAKGIGVAKGIGAAKRNAQTTMTPRSIERRFRAWLDEQGVSKNTVSAYCSYLKRYDPACYRFVGTEVSFADTRSGIMSVLPSDLFTVTDIHVFECAVAVLDNSRSYETLRPHSKNNSFSSDHSRLFSAVNKYLEFLRTRQSVISTLDMEAEREYLHQHYPRLIQVLESGTVALGDASRLKVVTKRASKVQATVDGTHRSPIEEAACVELPTAGHMRQLFERWLIEDERLSETQTKIYASCLTNFDSSIYRFADSGRLLSDPLAGLTSLLPDDLFVISNPRLMAAIERALKKTTNYERLYRSNDGGSDYWKDDRGKMHAAAKKYMIFLERRAQCMGQEQSDQEWEAFRTRYLSALAVLKNGSRDIDSAEPAPRHGHEAIRT